MKIAITAAGKTMEDRVFGEFEKSPFLLIYETKDGSINEYENDFEKDLQGIEIATIIKNEDCEAVITGAIEEKAFYLIADVGITRFKGDGMTIHDAIKQVEARKLVLIRDFKGAGPNHHHHH